MLNHVETANLLSDSLFATDMGRPVVGGRGIQPDMEVEYSRTPWFISELWRAGLFSTFISDTKPRIKPDTEVDEDLLERFRDYVLSEERDFNTPGSKELDDLAKLIEREELNESAALALEQLRQAMQGDIEAQLHQHEDWLQRMLTLELAERAGGSEARAKASLRFDTQFDRAVELMHSDGEYQALLSTPTERAVVD